MGTPENPSLDDSPIIVIETVKGPLKLHWGNAMLRVFKNVAYNHLDYHQGDGTVRGMLLPKEIMQTLVEYEFPALWRPDVDEASERWYIATMTQDIEKLDMEGLPPDVDGL